MPQCRISPRRRPVAGKLQTIACFTLLCALAACGGRPTHYASSSSESQYNPSRYYPPPGPKSDPWGPYIHEAAGRFGIPERWIRRVMRQESGGQEDVISWAGAMGLMQVMPETYDGLRQRYNLGDDPFDPHNNILAGAAYLREMYDRYGSPGFLAAYNAGPNRLDRYLNGGTPLPEETVNYVASIAPLLGPGTPMSGPLAVYGGGSVQLASRSSNGCDPDAAYNPDGPCIPAAPAVQSATFTTLASAAPPAPAYAAGACDPDAAYDPSRPCRPAPQASVQTVAAVIPQPRMVPAADCDPDAAYDPSQRCRPAPAYAPATAYAPPAAETRPPSYASARAYTPAPVAAETLPPPRFAAAPPRQVFAETQPAVPFRQSARFAPSLRRPLQEATGEPVTFETGPNLGAWGIQVGAYASLATAHAATEAARSAAPQLLSKARTELPPTAPFGSQIAYRARLSGLSQAAAADACARLSHSGLSCLTVPPNHAL